MQHFYTIIYKDRAFRDRFEILLASKGDAWDQGDLEANLKMIREMLRGSLVARQLEDESTFGASPTLAANLATKYRTEIASLPAELQSALVAGDPRKLDPPNDKKPGVKAPRDESGRVTHWIDGMDPCTHCKGKHLNRDCPDHKPSGEQKTSARTPSSARPASPRPVAKSMRASPPVLRPHKTKDA